MKNIYITFLLIIAITCASFTSPVKGYFESAEPVKIVRFYPNPATSFITFEFENPDKSYTFQVYSFIGKKMVDEPVSSSKTTLSLESYYRGLYIYQLRDKAGNIVGSGKFQVVK